MDTEDERVSVKKTRGPYQKILKYSYNQMRYDKRTAHLASVYISHVLNEKDLVDERDRSVSSQVTDYSGLIDWWDNLRAASHVPNVS